MNKLNITLDFDNINSLALEITKAYISVNDKTYEPKEFVAIFLSVYSKILVELELLKNNKDLLTNIIMSTIDIK